LAGWTVTLYNAATSNVIATTMTSFNGYYAFPNLSSATYQVRQFPPAGTAGVIQTTAEPANVSVAGNDQLVSPFGVWLPAVVSALTPSDELSNGRVVGTTPAGQRSRITRLMVTFNQPVVLSAGAISMQLLNTGGSGADNGGAPTDVTAALGALTPIGDGSQWYVPIVAAGSVSTEASGLGDGIYTLVVHAVAVAAANRGALAGGDASFTFHRLFGDTDGNKTVNNADFGSFRRAFSAGLSSAAYVLFLDVENNGVINNGDFGPFRNRYGRSLTYA
jgi:hypothetical protein